MNVDHCYTDPKHQVNFSQMRFTNIADGSLKMWRNRWEVYF